MSFNGTLYELQQEIKNAYAAGLYTNYGKLPAGVSGDEVRAIAMLVNGYHIKCGECMGTGYVRGLAFWNKKECQRCNGVGLLWCNKIASALKGQGHEETKEG